MRRMRTMTALAAASLAVAAAGAASVGASAEQAGRAEARAGVHLEAHFKALNSSGGSGRVNVHFEGRRAHVDLDAFGLAKGLPHAQHLHYGKEARHECPTIQDDADGNFRLNVAEGLPAYGTILKSLTNSGDTSPDSALAVNRFPHAPKGQVHYERTIRFSHKAVARAIKNGKGVIVIHGVDYNGNGKYDFASAGSSELDASLPAEATDPALCGVLRVAK